MPTRYQSMRRWDNVLQSGANDIAISPLGDFFAVASFHGPVFIFETLTESVSHIIQLQATEQASCCLWNSRPSTGNDASELELIFGTTHGLVVSVCLNAKVIQRTDDLFPGAILTFVFRKN